MCFCSSSLHDPATMGGGRPPITSLNLDDLQLLALGKYNGEVEHIVLYIYNVAFRVTYLGSQRSDIQSTQCCSVFFVCFHI